jgi:molybdopterin converting factor subunit 1
VITVRFFASLREQLGTGELEVAAAGVPTVAALVERLSAERGEAWREALSVPQLIVAINHQVTDRAAALADGDEVALFPPVTGG